MCYLGRILQADLRIRLKSLNLLLLPKLLTQRERAFEEQKHLNFCFALLLLKILVFLIN